VEPVDTLHLENVTLLKLDLVNFWSFLVLDLIKLKRKKYFLGYAENSRLEHLHQPYIPVFISSFHAGAV